MAEQDWQRELVELIHPSTPEPEAEDQKDKDEAVKGDSAAVGENGPESEEDRFLRELLGGEQ